MAKAPRCLDSVVSSREDDAQASQADHGERVWISYIPVSAYSLEYAQLDSLHGQCPQTINIRDEDQGRTRIEKEKESQRLACYRPASCCQERAEKRGPPKWCRHPSGESEEGNH